MLVEVTCRLDEEGLCEINKLEDGKESVFESKDFLSQNIGIGW